MRNRGRPIGVTVLGWVLAANGAATAAFALALALPLPIGVTLREAMDLPTGAAWAFGVAYGCTSAASGVGILRGARWSRVAYLAGCPALTAAYWLSGGFTIGDALFALHYLAPLWILTRPQARAYFGAGPRADAPRAVHRRGEASAPSVAAFALLAAGALLMLWSAMVGAAFVAVADLRGRGGDVLAGPAFLVLCVVSAAVAISAWGARKYAPGRARAPFGAALLATGAAALLGVASVTTRPGRIGMDWALERHPPPLGLDPFPSVVVAFAVLAAISIPTGAALALRQAALDRRPADEAAPDVE